MHWTYRDFFSRSRESSSSSRVCSSLSLTLLRWLTLSSAAWSSSPVFWLTSPWFFFSLLSLLMSSSWWAISSFRFLIWWSFVALSCSDFCKFNSRSSISFFKPDTSCSSFFLFWKRLFLASSSSLNLSVRSYAKNICINIGDVSLNTYLIICRYLKI